MTFKDIVRVFPVSVEVNKGTVGNQEKHQVLLQILFQLIKWRYENLDEYNFFASAHHKFDL